MKNKRLVIIISVLCVIVILAVLCSTLFSVQHVSLSFSSNTSKLADVTDEQIIKSAGFKKFESIFLVGKKDATAKIEHAYPYIKVRGIETVFPNKLIIHVQERLPYVCVKVSDTAYALVDKDLKVLEILDKSYVVGKNDPAIVTVEGFNLNLQDFRAGYKLSAAFNDILGGLMASFAEYGVDEYAAYDMLKGITITASHHQDITLETHYGITIVMQNMEALFEDKINMALSAYVSYRDESKVGTITIAGTDSVSAVFTPLE